MVTHRFVCDSCGNVIQDTNTKDVHVCACGEDMRWDLHNIGIADGDYHHVSDSLAIHPDDIPEHRKLFPNIEVLPDGRPSFNSVRQQEKYANRCGFEKRSQKIRSTGKKRIT